MSVLEEYECAAARLRAQLIASDDPDRDFPIRVRAALAIVLDALAADADLAQLLVVAPLQAGGPLLRLQKEDLERSAAALRRAARALPVPPEHPRFLEAALLAGVRRQIAIPAHAGRQSQLAELEPQLSRYLLSYYLPPSAIEEQGLSPVPLRLGADGG